MRVLVCGGRDYQDRERVYKVLDKLLSKYEDLMIIQGHARGADTFAFDWAIDREIPVLCVPAKWKQLGKSAGYIRNGSMLEIGKPDLVVAFPGGTGTRNMINQSEKQNVRVIQPKDKNDG